MSFPFFLRGYRHRGVSADDGVGVGFFALVHASEVQLVERFTMAEDHSGPLSGKEDG